MPARVRPARADRARTLSLSRIIIGTLARALTLNTHRSPLTLTLIRYDLLYLRMRGATCRHQLLGARHPSYEP